MKNMNITGAAEITLKTLHDDRRMKTQEESPGRWHANAKTRRRMRIRIQEETRRGQHSHEGCAGKRHASRHVSERSSLGSERSFVCCRSYRAEFI